ncbi:MAG: HD domain-containing protein [Deltaproteobacteria bacterium]|nr:HD domain-containing protein [Deltaproteobacteria bacterium]
MEPHVLLKDVVERSRVRGVYLCSQKTLARGRNERAYLSLTLSDRSGALEARVWDQAEAVARKFADQDLVRVEGIAVLYQGRVQLHLADVERVDGAGLDPADFMPASAQPVDQMWRDLRALAATVQSAPLKALLDAVLDDPALGEALRRSPAAKTIHHAFVGGLLQHTLSVARLVDVACAHYAREAPGLIDRDLAVCGAILHDLGKTRELTSDHGFGYSDIGRLLGHIVLGDALVEEKLRSLPDFPPDLAPRLRHVLVAHHGEREFGSPKRPKTVEAFVVHHADSLDCQLGVLHGLFAREQPRGWSSYQKLYDRYFLRGLQDGEAAADAPPVEPGDDEV